MSAYDPAHPAVAAAARDLSDAECDELHALLVATPEPFAPMGVVMLDGFLCGVLVQPEPVEPDAWLRYVFDAEGRRLPDEVAESLGHPRAVALMLRRQQAVNRALIEEGAFDPLIGDEDEDGDEGDDGVPAASRPLADWAAGFHFAASLFPGLEELDDDGVHLALARIYRHLPIDDAEQRELRAALDADWPLDSVDVAIVDLVDAVAELADFTRELRFQVETVKREAPKVGRNDPCPCGSGRKYKRCHGAAAP